MNIAIVEDEAPIARRLERAIRAELEGKVDSLVVLPTLDAAFAQVRERAPDIVFLDLNLGGQDGYRLLAEAAAARFRTVVVSAYEDQAVRAFELGVTDFVPKPWTAERLRLAIARATGGVAAAGTGMTRLAIRTATGIELVDLGRVVTVRAADDYSELRLEDGSTRLHPRSLAALAGLLPREFARVHRSWIVAVDRIRAWAPAPGGRATLDVNGDSIPVGRTYRRGIVARLKSDVLGSDRKLTGA